MIATTRRKSLKRWQKAWKRSLNEGSVVTFVRFGEKVREPVVEEGDADVIIAFERLEALRYAHFLKKDGVLVVNDCRIDPMTVVIGAAEYPENIIEGLEKEHSVYTIDGQKKALELGNSKVLNSVVLGYSAKFIGFDKETWLEEVKGIKEFYAQFGDRLPKELEVELAKLEANLSK